MRYSATLTFTHRSLGVRYHFLYKTPSCITNDRALILIFLDCLLSYGSFPSDKHSIIGFLQSFTPSIIDTVTSSSIALDRTISTNTCLAKCEKVDDASLLSVSTSFFFFFTWYVL